MIRLKSSVLLCLLFVSSIGKADEWKGWRGLEKQACADSGKYPVEWSAKSNILWKVDIPGEGHSSPVLNDKYVIVTAAEMNKGTSTFNGIIVKILALACLTVILYACYAGLKRMKKEEGIRKSELFSGMSTFAILGLLLFSFGIMYWMYSGQWTLHKTFLNYFFSGGVSLFCILMLASLTERTSAMRIYAGVIITVLVYFFFTARPRSDYFLDNIFLDPANYWLIPASVGSILMPVLFSFYLIVITVYRKLKKKAPVNSEERVFETGFARKAMITAFILGAAGFLIIPAISALKYFLIDDVELRIRPTFSAGLFLNPDFAFPFFIVILWPFFLFLFIREKAGREVNRSNPLIYTILLAGSLIFFVMLNVIRHEPQYERIVYCIDKNTGEIKWREKCLEGPAIKISNYNSQATPTPLVDDNNVYAYFGDAGLVSFDLNGRLKWENRNLPFRSPHGIGSSPVFCSSKIVILNSMADSSYVSAIDPSSGNRNWVNVLARGDGLSESGEYRTPSVYSVGDRNYIVEWSEWRREVVLYDASTGQAAYRYSAGWETSGDAVSSPTISDNIIYLTNPENILALDLRKVCSNENPVIWETSLNSRGPETSSPLVNKGLIFMISDNGLASCLECTSGKIVWQKRLPGSFLSSPVSAGNYIYFSNNAGVTTVIENSREFRQVSRNDLKEGIYATPAAVDGRFYLRTKNSLWCIE